ncbi:MAG: EAL domain-containing protein, partial [Gammaproteobacteria bacterium]
QQAIEQTEIVPDMIELELTESMLMEDHDFAIYILKQLKKVGVRLSIDDFGTGYSSLAYLKQFPVDAIKIDRSFVKDITNNQSDASIVRAIVNLGHTLDMHVIAEGVESQEQASLLKSFGVDLIQGYVYAKPMSENLCQEFLEKNKTTTGTL